MHQQFSVYAMQAQSQDARSGRPTTRPSTEAQDFSQSDGLQKRIDRMKLLKYHELNRVGELTRKQLNRTMQRLSKQRETSFQDSFDQLQHGLTSQDGIISQVDEILQQSASVKRQKKLQLFSEWDSQVKAQLQRCTCLAGTHSFPKGATLRPACNIAYADRHRQLLCRTPQTHLHLSCNSKHVKNSPGTLCQTVLLDCIHLFKLSLFP